jgi:uncharacterized SAM-binding protein YcdF (DUF218 family)
MHFLRHWGGRVYIYLSKILPLFVMPVSVVMILLIVGLLLLLKGARKTATSLFVIAVTLFWLASTPFVADTLYRALEARYRPVPLGDVPVSDCIVVLGGAVGPAVWPRVDIELNEAVDRVYKAAQLAREGRGRFVVVSGGDQPWSASPWAEAEVIRDLLVEWGVRADAIFLEGSSRNTRENALYSKNLLDSIHCNSTLLVTSAAHMPRAVAAFQSAGVDVVPVSTDVRVVDGGRLSVTMLLPDARALAMTSEAIREWIGRMFYQFQGWN